MNHPQHPINSYGADDREHGDSVTLHFRPTSRSQRRAVIDLFAVIDWLLRLPRELEERLWGR